MAFSAASIVHVSFIVAVVLFLFTATAASGSNATVATDATAMAPPRSTEALPAAAAQNGSLEYICYLCRKRNTLMIRRCPLEKDDCHLACLSLPTPSPPSPPGSGVAAAAEGDRGADDCYVMKLYPDGSWVVVDVVSCRAAAGCYLVCSNGDERGRDVAAGTTTPATPSGQLPQGLPDFERCGDQLIAPRAAGV